MFKIVCPLGDFLQIIPHFQRLIIKYDNELITTFNNKVIFLYLYNRRNNYYNIAVTAHSLTNFVLFRVSLNRWFSKATKKRRERRSKRRESEHGAEA